MRTLARDRDKADILRRLKSLHLTSARRWGRMSVHQMVCHLSDSCRILTGQRQAAAVARPLPPAMMKWIALYLPLRWPPGLLTTPELDQEVGGTKPLQFAADLAELEGLLERITTDLRSSLEGQVHPIFGQMSEAAWLRWAYLHTDHHLRQFGV